MKRIMALLLTVSLLLGVPVVGVSAAEETKIALQQLSLGDDLCMEFFVATENANAQIEVAVLGDMLELGVFSQALHTGVGEYIGKTDIGCLIAIGSQAEAIAQGARDAGVSEVYHYAEKEDAKETLCRMISADTTFLLKASRGMHMEELTEYLIEQTKEG